MWRRAHIEMLLTSMIKPRLDAAVVWPTHKKLNFTKLEGVQRIVVKMIDSLDEYFDI